MELSRQDAKNAKETINLGGVARNLIVQHLVDQYKNFNNLVIIVARFTTVRQYNREIPPVQIWANGIRLAAPVDNGEDC
jgi:hypothetical protein